MIGTYVCTYTVPYSNTIFLKDFGLFTSCYFLLLSPSDPLLHPHTFFTLSFLFLPPLFPSFFSSSFAFSFPHSLSPYLSLTPSLLSSLFSSLLPITGLTPVRSSQPLLWVTMHVRTSSHRTVLYRTLCCTVLSIDLVLIDII